MPAQPQTISALRSPERACVVTSLRMASVSDDKRLSISPVAMPSRNAQSAKTSDLKVCCRSRVATASPDRFKTWDREATKIAWTTESPNKTSAALVGE
eukprot:scaffold193309_cov29-Tisochrysis_lutea.AAC.3